MSKEKSIDEMTPEELKDYEESLDNEIKIRELKTKQKELDAAKAEEAKTAADETKAALMQEAKEAIFKEHPEWAPKPKVATLGETSGAGEESGMQKYYNGYRERNIVIESLSKYENKYEDKIKDARFQVRKNDGGWGEVGLEAMFSNTDSDTGCEDDVGDWSPDDVYSKIVWETFVCKADLFSICVKGLSIGVGDGLGVQIRAFGAFGDPTALGSCECGSCASITFSTYSLTLSQYNLEAIICDKDIWDVGNVLMDSYLKAMADSWARRFDELIYAELETATPGTEVTLSTALVCTPGALTGSCCSDLSMILLYNAIHSVIENMREGTGLAGPYNPDVIILSPTVAGIFKRLQTPQPMPGTFDVVYDDDGRMKKIGGLRVIEYCGANTCTDLSGQEVAVIIDSRRAVGAVFGQRPKTYKFFQSNCNSYRIDQWAYFAVGELDTDAIGHVVNV